MWPAGRKIPRSDIEKAYDSLLREELWFCMRESGVAEKYVRLVYDMYESSMTLVGCAVIVKDGFKLDGRLHQGLPHSPSLFATVLTD